MSNLKLPLLAFFASGFGSSLIVLIIKWNEYPKGIPIIIWCGLCLIGAVATAVRIKMKGIK